MWHWQLNVNLRQVQKKADNGQDMFHKLSGVASRAGGLMCSKLFVSAFALKNKDGRDSQSLLYAKDHNIIIIQAEDIINQLPTILQNWKARGQLSNHHIQAT